MEKEKKMSMKSDIQIAQESQLKPIREIASDIGIGEEFLELYGTHKAKIDYNLLKDLENKENGKLILVTAITPTPAGEGKTTTTVGLSDSL